jgi:hypothetical protein
MEERKSTKRKTYPAPEYARLLGLLNRAMENVDKLHPDRNRWDVEGDWNSTGVIYFLDSRLQTLFADFEQFDCRSIKLVNYGKPAVRLTFFRKHKYWLLRNADLNREDKQLRVMNYINELVVKAEIMTDRLDALPGFKQSEQREKVGGMREEIRAWQQVLEQIDDFELAVSNYRRDYQYVTLNYKYRLETGEYANGQEHLLNPQRDNQGVVTQPRYNLIFVDVREIEREHPHQHKEIENYLNNFSLMTQSGKQQLYARRRPETEGLVLFDSSPPSVPDPPALTLFD